MFNRMENNGRPSPGVARSAPAQPLNPSAFLMGRIAEQANYSDYVENQTNYPVANGTVNAPREHGNADAVVEMPLMHIMIYPGMAGVQDLTPLITADGGPVTPTARGSWGQLYAAGRMG